MNKSPHNSRIISNSALRQKIKDPEEGCDGRYKEKFIAVEDDTQHQIVVLPTPERVKTEVLNTRSH